MRYFWIIDSKKPKRAKPCGLLAYDKNTKEFSIQINSEADIEHVPMLFIPFMEKGQRTIPPRWALEWVKERIVPANRQNIGEILEAHNLEEYDEFTLLLGGQGRCSQDDFMIKEVSPCASDKSERGNKGKGKSRGDSKLNKFEQAFSKRSVYEYAVVALPSLTESTLKNMVGDQIRKARQNLGMSQEELAAKSGVPRPAISRIERGLANPTLETIALLCDATSTTPLFKLI